MWGAVSLGFSNERVRDIINSGLLRIEKDKKVNFMKTSIYREQFKRLLLFCFAALIIVAEAYIYYRTWVDYYNEGMTRPLVFRGYLVIILVYVILLVALSNVYGAFKLGSHRVTDILFSQALSLVIVNFVSYLQISLLHVSLVNPGPLLVATLMEFCCIVIWATMEQFVYAVLFPPHRTLMVYSDHDPDRLFKKMTKRRDRYNICGSIHVNEGIRTIMKEIRSGKYEAVILADIPGSIRNDIIKNCFYYNIRVYMTPKISDVIISGGDTMHMFDTPLVLMRNRGLSFEQKIVKRLIDLVVSLLVLIIFLPFFLIIALCIKLYDGGPIFYTQRRLTKDGKVFKILKFRSMKMDSEKKGARLAAKNDDRITPIGHIIRNIHVDELPQLLNILKGDMSFVGPRPERPEIAKQYLETIPEFNFRLKVKAGLTGYAQIYGKYNTTPYDKLKLDLYYIENYSVLLDLRLILMTVKILFIKENSEGVDQTQTTALTERKEKK